MEVNWIDIVVGVVLLIAVIHGAMKGLVWQLAAIGAIVLCFAFSETVSPLLAQAIPVDSPLDRWLAMFALYVAAGLLCYGVGWRIRDWMEAHRIKEFDHRLGAVFGFVKGVVFLLVVMFFSVTSSAQIREAVLQSHSGYYAAVVMDCLHPVMPAEFHDKLHPYIHQLDEAMGGSTRHLHDDDSDHDHEPEPIDDGWGGRGWDPPEPGLDSWRSWEGDHSTDSNSRDSNSPGWDWDSADWDAPRNRSADRDSRSDRRSRLAW